VSTSRIGVLALQGAFREHVSLLRALGADAVEVRTPEELERCAGLVLPGGESTTIGKLLASSGLDTALGDYQGPLLGTCAGMILLAREASDGLPGQLLLGVIDIVVQRNGYGRQLHSFEADLELEGDPQPLHGVFIRAPRIERVGAGAHVFAHLDGEPVAVEQGRAIATSFHPELAGEARVHERFLERVRTASAATAV
jgi:pyridoxal 5'-phosphate synthase pdxT subunit